MRTERIASATKARPSFHPREIMRKIGPAAEVCNGRPWTSRSIGSVRSEKGGMRTLKRLPEADVRRALVGLEERPISERNGSIRGKMPRAEPAEGGAGDDKPTAHAG